VQKTRNRGICGAALAGLVSNRHRKIAADSLDFLIAFLIRIVVQLRSFECNLGAFRWLFCPSDLPALRRANGQQPNFCVNEMLYR
jgi:hypothetical protein